MRTGSIAGLVAGAFACLILGIAIGRSGPDAPAPVEAAAPTEAQTAGATGETVATLETRPADAPRAAPAEPDRFAFVTYRADVGGDAPRACFVFNAPLDPEADYSPYVALSPSAPVAITAAGESLCLGGLAFGEERTATLRAGLPAADGRTLAREETAPIEFGDRPAYVGFKGDGVVLPRRDADGLAVETVNVDALSVRVWRVNDRALVFKRISGGESVPEGRYSWLYGENDPSDVAALVWEGEMDTPGALNTPTTTVFPLASALGSLQPGAYFVELADASAEDDDNRRPASAHRWILFTDLALSTYQGADGLDVVARSLQSAEPARNAELRLLARNNEVLGAARADVNGRARFEAPLLRGEGPLSPKLLLAYGPEGDFAVLDLERAPLDLSGENVSGRARSGPVDAYVYFERDIYRPGETVRATALVRDPQARALADRPGALVVYRPNGVEAARQRFESATEFGGAWSWDYAVSHAAPRGAWRMVAEIDGVGAVAAAGFDVEDFVPQRIAVELEADADAPMTRDETRPIDVDVRFLYGAPGAGLPVESEARLQRDPKPFPKYSDYSFGLHDASFREEVIELGDAVADGAGEARLNLAMRERAADAQMPLRANVVVRVQEPGGRAVAESVRLPYRPRDRYLGVKPGFEGRAPRNADTVFEVAALSRLGEPVNADLTWKVIEIDYEYDWWRDNGGRWQWRRTRNTRTVEEGRVDTGRDGVGRIALRGLSWGDHRLVVSDGETGAEASYGFWVGWGGRAQDGVEAPDRVRVAGPSEAPRVGDRAEITIAAPYSGQAQVVVATDRVVSVNYLQLDEDGAEITLPVTENWGAGAYVLVTAFTPRDAVSRPQPRRAVGLTYVPVNVEDRTYEMTLDAPELARPDTNIDVLVTATGGPAGERAWVTLAAVDEGVLRLTKFESPDPTEWFFGRRALGVELRDDYGRLLDPNQGAAAPVRVGGDQLGGEGLSVVPTKTVALFSGPVALDGEGQASIPLALPPFNGELRLMAVAWSASGLGAVAQPMTVREPVPAEMVLPRFLAPGDQAVATVSLDNVEGAPGLYQTTISAEGPLTALGAEVAQELSRGERGDALVTISAQEVGIGAFSLEASGPDAFTSARSYDLQVRSAYLPIRNVERALLEPGESYTLGAGASNIIPASASATVTFSPFPMDAGALYASLSRYPYGCTEQVTSRALPLLYAGDLAAVAAEDGPRGAREKLQEAVETLLSRQGSDGVIGLWREGDRSASPWLGAYATDFLARAKQAGLVVPDDAMNRAYAALSGVADGVRWRAAGYDFDAYGARSEEAKDNLRRDAQAYALYVLARAGRADIARLRYVHDQELTKLKSPLSRAFLGAGLAALGDNARAANAFDAAENVVGTWESEWDYYQTPLRDTAGVLALAAEANETDRVERVGDRLLELAPDPEELSTQEKSFALLAVSALLDGADAVRIARDNVVIGAGESGPMVSLDAAGIAAAPVFTNQGEAPVWRTRVLRGAPIAPPAAASAGVSALKNVYTLDGEPADLGGLVQGDRVVVKITLTPRQQRVNPMIIADLLPAGLEIETVLRPADGERTNADDGAFGWLGEITRLKTAEARDDRFVAAVDLGRGEVTMAYIARAVTSGEFAAPGVVAEDMYRADVFARTGSRRMRIVPRDSRPL